MLLTNYWKPPHISKVYEALGAIGDNRIEITEKSEELVKAKMYSSSRNKHYDVIYNPKEKTIISNDNSAYYVGEFSYPMISLLMVLDEIDYPEYLTEDLSNIKWKDINQKFKNDFDKTVEFVLEALKSKGMNSNKLENDIKELHAKIC